MRGGFYDRKTRVRNASKEYPVFEGVPSDMRNLMELFLVNYFKERADTTTSDELVSLITHKLPGIPLFRSLLLAGVAWTLCGIETQSKGTLRWKYLNKFEHQDKISELALGFYNLNSSSIFARRTNVTVDVNTIMHELTHALCDVIYKNKAEPFSSSNHDAKQKWESYVRDVIEAGKKIETEKKSLETINFYNSISHFIGYQKDQYTRESIAYLVGAHVDFEDVPGKFRSLTGETYDKASELIKQFTKDCYQWAVNAFLDSGFRLLDTKILAKEEISAVQTAMAGDITETGQLYLTHEQAAILDAKVPVIDVWLYHIFKNLHTNHWREGINKFGIKALYEEYYQYLDDIEHGKATSQKDEPISEDVIIKRLLTHWNEAYLKGKISLNGLFEGIVRFFGSMRETEQSSRLFGLYFAAFFKMLDRHAAEDAKQVKPPEFRYLKFDYNRAINYAAKHFHIDYFDGFLALAKEKYGPEAGDYYAPTAYWFGASCDIERYKRWKESTKYGSDIASRIESTIVYAMTGAMDYGHTIFISELLKYFPEVSRQAINHIFNQKEFSTRGIYKNPEVFLLVFNQFPEQRLLCIWLYLEACKISAKNISFSQVMHNLKVETLNTSEMATLVFALARNEYYDQLTDLFEFLTAKSIQMDDIMIRQYLETAIKSNDLNLLKIILRHCDPIQLYVHYRSLHLCAELNRHDMVKYIQKHHQDFFNGCSLSRNDVDQTPYEIAIDKYHYRLASLLNPEQFIQDIRHMVKAPLGLAALEIAVALAEYGKKHENELLAYLDKVDVESFRTVLQSQQAPYLLDIVAANRMTRVLSVLTVSNRWPEILTLRKSFTPLSAAVKAGDMQTSQALCDCYLKQFNAKNSLKLLIHLTKLDCIELVDYLLARNPDWLQQPLDITYHSIKNPTLMMVATLTHSRAVLNWLKTNYALPQNYNPLILLTLEGSGKHMEELLQDILQQGGGKYFPLQDEHGRTPMHYAAQGHSSLATMQLYYSQYDDVDLQDNDGLTPLHYALKDRKFEIAAFLIEDCRAAQLGEKRPLHFAAWFGGMDCLKMILARHPNELNAIMPDGDTALSLAIKSGHDDIAMYLIKCGAALDVGKYQINDLIMLAKKHQMHAIAKKLININLKSELKTSSILQRNKYFSGR